MSCFLFAISAQETHKVWNKGSCEFRGKNRICPLFFDVYTWKSATKKMSKSVCHSIVVELLEPYFGKGCWVFMDNYYSNPKLFAELFTKKKKFVCHCQIRKEFPESLKSNNNKLEVGQYHFARRGELLAVLWHDRKDVTLLTTTHNRSVCTVMKQPKGSREKVPVPCPTCVVDYNAYMGGVDLTDQYLSYYTRTNRRIVK